MTGLQDALRQKGYPEAMAWNLGHFIDMLNDGAALDELLDGPDGPEMHDLYRTLRVLLGEGDPGSYDADYKPNEEEEADSPITQEDPSPRADDLVVDAEDVPAAEEEEEEDDDEDSDMAEEIDDADVNEDRPWA